MRSCAVAAFDVLLLPVCARAACTFKIVGNEAQFTGCNVVIRNGTGDTGSVQNGLGNLVIGYNNDDPKTGVAQRTGSHNLIIGDDTPP
jgi:hypothetical protein